MSSASMSSRGATLAALSAFALLLCGASAGRASTLSEAGSPVEKIVTLLTDLKTALESDEEKEQKAFDKFSCWCETTTQRKGASISQAQKDIKSLGEEIIKQKSNIALADTAIHENMDDIESEEQDQAAKTVERQKENDKFVTEKREWERAIVSLEEALEVLKPSFLQVNKTAASRTASKALQKVIDDVPLDRLAGLPAKQFAALQSYAKDVASGEYAPMSATLANILKELHKTFTDDLTKATETETDQQSSFDNLVSGSQKSIQDMRQTVQDEETKKGDAALMLAEAIQTFDNTEAQMKADRDFFENTQQSCEAKSDEFKTRKDLRAEELEGVVKTLEILTSPENRRLFGKSFQPNFLQVDDASAANRAFQTLKKHARQAQSLRLTKLAVQLRMGGHFDEVVTQVEDMVKTLREEADDDKKKRDTCKKDYQRLDMKIALNDHKALRAKKKVAKYTAEIENLEKNIEATIAKDEETKNTLDVMKAERESEKAAFESAKQDDEDAIAVIENAMDTLKAFYDKETFVQEPKFDDPDRAPETTFSDKGNRKAKATGILTMMNMLKQNLEREISDGEAAEQNAIDSYTKTKADLEQVRDDLAAKKAELEETKGTKESNRDDEQSTQESHETTSRETLDEKDAIRPECDWILKAFGERAQRRKEELDGLEEAKGILQGGI